MNRSDAELERIASQTASAAEVPPWELRFLDAEASLETNAFTLSVVNAFQALELSLEGSLEKSMADQGLTGAEIQDGLSRTWRTKERLKDSVPFLTGHRLVNDHPRHWDRFCWAYDDIRNKLIHAARDLDYDKADRPLTACRDVSQWLNVVA